MLLSTADQVTGLGLLTNIRKAKNLETVDCSAGSACSSLRGEFGSVIVKHNPHSIANVLLLNEAKHASPNDVRLQRLRGSVPSPHQKGAVEFKPSARGLLYHNVSDAGNNIQLLLVNTARENFEQYTCHNAERARMIAHPTEREFAGMVCEQFLSNFPVTVQDNDKADWIFGPDLANLRGKTTRAKPEHV